ncbi:MAG TPA: nuclear transport factor 2 family protein [Gammaproteobacteria bacterium]|nr:nuclear transport factor 2 family protein [Gammaproteobacteria bacterium]
MRHILLALAPISFLLLSPLATAATGDEKQLLDLEQRWLVAGERRDIPALREILGDDFVDVSYQGKLRSKADHLAATLAPSKSRQTLEELQVRLYGDTGIVNGLDHVVTADGSAAYEIRFTDMFVKRKGRWQAVSAQETLEKNP